MRVVTQAIKTLHSQYVNLPFPINSPPRIDGRCYFQLRAMALDLEC